MMKAFRPAGLSLFLGLLFWIGADARAPHLKGYTSEVSIQSSSSYGVPYSSEAYPSLIERQVLTFTNLCRMSPSSCPQGTGLTAVPPLYYNLKLNEAARGHSSDLANTASCSFSHTSCDGTSFADRISKYYSGAAGENIAQGYSDAKTVLDGWMNSDGHRSNIMRSSYVEMGAGYASGSNMERVYTQNFGGSASSYNENIYSGAHYITGGNLQLYATYYDGTGASPAAVEVVFDDKAYTMNLEAQYTFNNQGTYTYTFAEATDTGCRKYYFTATAADGTVARYPGLGHFYTSGEQYCTVDYGYSASEGDTTSSSSAPGFASTTFGAFMIFSYTMIGCLAIPVFGVLGFLFIYSVLKGGAPFVGSSPQRDEKLLPNKTTKKTTKMENRLASPSGGDSTYQAPARASATAVPSLYENKFVANQAARFNAA